MKPKTNQTQPNQKPIIKPRIKVVGDGNTLMLDYGPFGITFLHKNFIKVLFKQK